LTTVTADITDQKICDVSELKYWLIEVLHRMQQTVTFL